MPTHKVEYPFFLTSGSGFHQFSFCVKFYTSEPGNLHEEITKYQFFLQLKQDILVGNLPGSDETMVTLAGLVLQCKLENWEWYIITCSIYVSACNSI